MGSRAVQRGDAGRRVATNVRVLRRLHGWTLEDVSRKLGEVGRPLVASGVAKLEDGTRRVDVDDLVALAEVFGLSPNDLLLVEHRPADAPSAVANLVTRSTLSLGLGVASPLDDALAWARMINASQRFLREAPAHGIDLTLESRDMERLLTERYGTDSFVEIVELWDREAADRG